MSRFKQRLVTSVGPSSINKCALVISIQCTQLRHAVLEFILIILLGLSHILSYHMSTLRLIAVWAGAGCDSRVMTMKYDGSGVWCLGSHNEFYPEQNWCAGTWCDPR